MGKKDKKVEDATAAVNPTSKEAKKTVSVNCESGAP